MTIHVASPHSDPSPSEYFPISCVQLILRPIRSILDHFSIMLIYFCEIHHFHNRILFREVIPGLPLKYDYMPVQIGSEKLKQIYVFYKKVGSNFFIKKHSLKLIMYILASLNQWIKFLTSYG